MQVTKPSKQRKMLFQAPDHVRRRFFAAPLSSELVASQGVRSLPVRSGDTVRVMRGDHKGFEGKISRVDRKEYRVFVEGLTREKVDGTAIPVAVHPSKVMLTSLNLDDKWRKKILERKKTAATREAEKKPEKKPRKRIEKPPEVVEVKERAVEEKAPRKKTIRKRKRAAEKKPSEKTEDEHQEATKEEKPKKKRATKRKLEEKTEGEG
jgi:large subunit ribosomal protein L24